MLDVKEEVAEEPSAIAISGPADAAEQSEEPKQQAARKKKGKGVRFVTTAEGEVVPDKVKFERPSNSRAKAHEALECLLAGNERFKKGALERCRAGPEIVSEVADEASRPSTVILACSDSRVPPEIILDQGLGDCHVVRVAGNVVNDFVLGSILFAVQHLGCRLVVVLGHSRCSVVASAVQSWARRKSLTRGSATVRTLAESVQQTLGQGPQPEDAAPQVPVQSPFSATDAQEEKTSGKSGRSGILARFCAGCRGQEQPDKRENEITGAATPPQAQRQGSGGGVNKKSPSSERSIGRSSMGRSSINPLTALVGAIGGAVEAVANSGQHDAGFKSLVHKEKKDRDLDSDGDYENLKRGLAKQDSLEFTRARLAKQRAERKIEALRQLSTRDDVDTVINENVKVSASAILKGLVKNLDVGITHDTEVVAARYDINTGSVEVLSRSWYLNHTYYNSTD